ncbi:helix-turn-helix domain-containing protein [Anaerostipes sp.]|uniref:helix-turn-helix domain-containing protein n=1 Tax=Anaerostipes sp. TaxID=1872530 RepID=UPI0025C57F17|nr:helix-turn-helix domain-containing protein [Anaerostipes sp.]MBS7007428.1 helix-turn-helix domain-containing protein [Anaerostipes sp.]
MDNKKTGRLICDLRKEKGLTQLQLAERMHISDKTVSKWERGLGCPDVSLLPELSELFGIELEKLLSGDLSANEILGGNMKKMKFYVCPDCGNLITAMTDSGITCCGRKLIAAQPVKAEEDEKLTVEMIENDYFISSSHEMTRDHYISFAALVTGDGIILKKLYPEWDFQTRIPAVGHGMLVWHCTKHGFFYQAV